MTSTASAGPPTGSPGRRRPGHVPDVTVVTVTYEAADLVATCLDALAVQELDGLDLEVVVVDNASSDGTAQLVANHYPWVRLVRSASNRGFAGGNNLVLDSVASPWVIVLNNDAIPEPGLVSTLVTQIAAAAPDVAALTARVLLLDRFRAAGPGDPPSARVTGPSGTYVQASDGPIALVNSTGNQVRTDGYGVDRGWLAEAARHHPEPEVFGFCGAAAILRTAALREVGTFDEDFFLYYEDTDLSWRLRLAGYTIRYCADAVVHHVHAASTGEGSELFRFHDARNRLLMLVKDATAALAVRSLVRYVITTVSIAMHRSQPRAHVVIRLRVVASVLRLLPRMLARRRVIGRRARASRADVGKLLVGVGGEPSPGYRI